MPQDHGFITATVAWKYKDGTIKLDPDCKPEWLLRYIFKKEVRQPMSASESKYLQEIYEYKQKALEKTKKHLGLK